MNNTLHIFSDRELIEILSLSPNATAIYTSEQIVIQNANDAMLSIWGKNKSVIGLPLIEALPELKGQQFIDILKNVWNTGITYKAADMPANIMIDGELKTFYYDFTYHALKNENGTYCILHTATDVTERNLQQTTLAQAKMAVGALETEQALNEELMATNEELNATNEEMLNMQQSLQELNNELEKRVADRVHDLAVSEKQLEEILNQLPAPVTVLRGKNQVIELTNQSILSFWNKTREEVIGKPMLEVFPILRDQPFPGQWKQVLETGVAVANREKPVTFNTPDGGTKQFYVDYYYQPLVDYDGNRTAVLATVIDVTDKVQSRKQLEESQDKLLNLNDELSAINEEMISTNDELTITNKELAETRKNLLKTVNEVEKSEARFRFLVKQAPVAITILNGRELRIESVNDIMLNILGKSTDIIGKTYAQALPEFQDQPYLKMLDDVFTTGKPYFGSEARTVIEKNGELITGYYNFIFQPIQNEQEVTTTVMIVATDVTEQVKSRKQLQRTEETLRLSIEAANVGTWHFNNKTKEFLVSTKLKELFGYEADQELTYEMAVAHIPDSHRTEVLKAMGATGADNTHYNIEFPILGSLDENLRWVKALGKSEIENEGGLSNFSGVIMDITEQKQDELRKNDFIGMVSHELKTPLTSLNGYTQILHQKAVKAGDRFSISALEKVNIQIKKMTSMINGFLNISRLESGKIHLQKEHFYLDELMQELVEETKLTTSSHEISISSKEHVKIYADRDKIGSVISNLLSNAIKYSPLAKKIEVSCNLEENGVQLSVKDEGMGIRPHDVEKLFDRFYRVEGNQNQNISGFGIGLYLSAEIIERHDGQIGVDSEIGKGSTFYFNLPVDNEIDY